MGQDRNFSMHVALLTAVDDAGEGFKLGNAQHELELPPGNKGEIYYMGLPWVDPCGRTFSIKNTVS